MNRETLKKKSRRLITRKPTPTGIHIQNFITVAHYDSSFKSWLENSTVDDI
ncbi:hypothetical protein [Candidatus Nitrosotalea okcheonensis]|uniref:Uncharacterized protein n=1 Tax=Candidatus Nitrosotalea okcheonensis TaxID=1903276 RepID=A0A2H1FC82_9ARCH|nr:hypothetical protein [Candidatus Nitrosotalea okcheonensis]SMH70376.1 protein of unknown function [Candidatus Nitrosotalea okcheonensis]